MATNYQRGRAFEYRTRDKLKKMGAAYVMRAAQSKGIVDLVAFFPRPWNDVWLVQAKRDGRLPAHEEIELVALAEAIYAYPVLAKAGPNGRGVEFIHLNSKEPIGR